MRSFLSRRKRSGDTGLPAAHGATQAYTAPPGIQRDKLRSGPLPELPTDEFGAIHRDGAAVGANSMTLPALGTGSPVSNGAGVVPTAGVQPASTKPMAIYGYTGVSWEQPLDTATALPLVQRITRHIVKHDLDVPLLFSSQALDLSAHSTANLVRALLATITVQADSADPAADFDAADSALEEELRFANVHDLVALLKWVLARIGRVVAERMAHGTSGELVLVHEHGFVPWTAYLDWRAQERCRISTPGHYLRLLGTLDSSTQQLLEELLALFTHAAVHSARNGMTPSRISRLFGAAIFGLPEDAPFAATYRAYVRASNATEHILLAYMRYYSSQTAETYQPRRLLEMVRSYPSGPYARDLDSLGDQARSVPATYVKRNVRQYTGDLVQRALQWPVDTPEWAACQTEDGTGKPTLAGKTRKLLNQRARRGPASTLPEEDKDSEDAPETLAAERWGAFATGGFGELDTSRLTFDLRESERRARMGRVQSMQWYQFEKLGFNQASDDENRWDWLMRFDDTVSQEAQQHADAQAGTKLPREDSHLLYGHPLPFPHDTEPRTQPTAFDEVFAEVWADFLVGNGWSNRDELVHRPASFAVMQIKSRPSAAAPATLGVKSPYSRAAELSADAGDVSSMTALDDRTGNAWFVFEEYVPPAYRDVLEASGFPHRHSLPMLRKLNLFRKVRDGVVPPSVIAVVDHLPYPMADENTPLPPPLAQTPKVAQTVFPPTEPAPPVPTVPAEQPAYQDVPATPTEQPARQDGPTALVEQPVHNNVHSERVEQPAYVKERPRYHEERVPGEHQTRAAPAILPGVFPGVRVGKLGEPVTQPKADAAPAPDLKSEHAPAAPEPQVTESVVEDRFPGQTTAETAEPAPVAPLHPEPPVSDTQPKEAPQPQRKSVIGLWEEEIPATPTGAPEPIEQPTQGQLPRTDALSVAPEDPPAAHEPAAEPSLPAAPAASSTPTTAPPAPRPTAGPTTMSPASSQSPAQQSRPRKSPYYDTNPTGEKPSETAAGRPTNEKRRTPSGLKNKASIRALFTQPFDSPHLSENRLFSPPESQPALPRPMHSSPKVSSPSGEEGGSHFVHNLRSRGSSLSRKISTKLLRNPASPPMTQEELSRALGSEGPVSKSNKPEKTPAYRKASKASPKPSQPPLPTQPPPSTQTQPATSAPEPAYSPPRRLARKSTVLKREAGAPKSPPMGDVPLPDLSKDSTDAQLGLAPAGAGAGATIRPVNRPVQVAPATAANQAAQQAAAKPAVEPVQPGKTNGTAAAPVTKSEISPTTSPRIMQDGNEPRTQPRLNFGMPLGLGAVVRPNTEAKSAAPAAAEKPKDVSPVIEPPPPTSAELHAALPRSALEEAESSDTLKPPVVPESPPMQRAAIPRSPSRSEGLADLSHGPIEPPASGEKLATLREDRTSDPEDMFAEPGTPSRRTSGHTGPPPHSSPVPAALLEAAGLSDSPATGSGTTEGHQSNRSSVSSGTQRRSLASNEVPKSSTTVSLARNSAKRRPADEQGSIVSETMSVPSIAEVHSTTRRLDASELPSGGAAAAQTKEVPSMTPGMPGVSAPSAVPEQPEPEHAPGDSEMTASALGAQAHPIDGSLKAQATESNAPGIREDENPGDQVPGAW